MSEIKWPPPVVNLPAAAVVEAPPDDVVAVVPAQAAGGRSKRRAFMLVVVVVLLGCGAVLVGRRGSNGSPSYSIAHAAVQLEDSKRLAFVGSAVLDSGETMTERFRIDVDRQLVQIDLLSGEKVNELGKTSTLADLDGQMFYVWHDDTPLQPAGWLGGRIDPGTARYYGAMLRFAPQTLAVAGRFRDAGLENQGIVDVDGERVTKYEVNIDADTLGEQPNARRGVIGTGRPFRGHADLRVLRVEVESAGEDDRGNHRETHAGDDDLHRVLHRRRGQHRGADRIPRHGRTARLDALIGFISELSLTKCKSCLSSSSSTAIR